jgi:hypothetical protein
MPGKGERSVLLCYTWDVNQLNARIAGVGVSTLKNQSPSVRAACGLLLAAATLAFTGCGQNLYKFPATNFAGRPIPPSQLANRVMVAVANPGPFSGGELEILDANRDIRNNVQNTVFGFFIAGYANRVPTTIASFPEQGYGQVYGSGDGTYTRVSYGSETVAGSTAGLPPISDSIATISSDLQVYAASSSSSAVVVVDNSIGRTIALNLPGAQHVVTNVGGTVVLVTTRNTNNLYRIVKLNNNVLPPANTYNDCEPLTLPVYCVVPVNNVPASPATNNIILDRPTGVVFSLDGGTAYVLNCGPECGGATSSITALNTAPLNVNNIPTVGVASPQLSNVAVPGGATVGLTDGTNLYVAGQQLVTSGPAAGLFTGEFTVVSLTGATPVAGAPLAVPDGTHSSLLFADDNTLWVGSTLCSNGAKGFLAQNLPAGTINLNCLAVYTLGSNVTPTVVPAVSPTSPVLYPNQNNDQFYYGDLTGICWVQNLHKVYSAYGGQVHAFMTNNLSEIDNSQITVQGTAENVVYMDALTNAAN